MKYTERARLPCPTCDGKRRVPDFNLDTSKGSSHTFPACPDCENGLDKRYECLRERCDCVFHAGTPYDGMADPRCVCKGIGFVPVSPDRALREGLKRLPDGWYVGKPKGRATYHVMDFNEMSAAWRHKGRGDTPEDAVWSAIGGQG